MEWHVGVVRIPAAPAARCVPTEVELLLVVQNQADFFRMQITPGAAHELSLPGFVTARRIEVNVLATRRPKRNVSLPVIQAFGVLM
jgi:hypothetical protein